MDTATPELYDPARPWVSSAEDDPNRANWLAHFFNPLGYTSKFVFLRGQSLLWIIRLVSYFIAVVVGGQAGAAVGGAIVFGVFALCALMSLCLHIRRLADADKPVVLAWIAIVPMIAATAAGLFFLLNPADEAANSASEPTAVERVADAPSDGATETDASADAPPPPSNDDSERPSALPKVVTQAFNVWLGLGFFAMLFSLRWLAGQPSKASER